MTTPLIEFPADDAERALRFWNAVLGAELSPRPAAAGAGWVHEADGMRFGIHERGRGPGDTGSLAYFAIPDMGAALGRVTEFGGQIVHPGERWSICRDSEGTPFALEHSPT
jgi:predicted enzyme related to lactoylglutathione lyase